MRPAWKSKPIASTIRRPKATWAACGQALEQRRIGLPRGLLDRLNDRDQVLLDLLEDLLDVGRAGARLELVHQGVVRLALVADLFGDLPLQIEELFQVRGEEREPGLLAGLDPGLLGQRDGPSDFLYEAGGELDRPIVQAPHLAPVGRDNRVLVVFLLDLFEQLPQPVVDQLLVRQAGD